MPAFSQIGELFLSRVLPVLLIAAVGYVAHKLRRFDIATLNQLNLYVFVPAILFTSLQRTLDDAGLVAAIVVGQALAMGVIGWALSKALSQGREATSVVSMGAMFPNCGNFGLPLMELAFGAAALGYQSIVLVTTNLMMFTVGIAIISAGRRSPMQSLVSFLKLPMVYVIGLSLAMRHYDLTLWAPAQSAVDYLSAGLVPIALVTLGAQLADVGRSETMGPTFLAGMLRLVVGPCVMFGLVRLLGVEGLAAKVLVLGAAAPTAVNTLILAIEFENRPSLAANIVLWTTLLCAVTVSVVLYFVEAVL